MKFFILTVLLLISKLSFSQTSDSIKGTTVEYLTKIFSRIPLKPSDLVPYYGNEKWGYIDRITKKIIVQPLFYDTEFFNPDVRTYFNGEIVNITGAGLVSIERQNENGNYVENKGPDIDSKVKSSSSGFKGFTVSKTGELIAYSDLYWYNRQGIPGWNIQLIKYQDRYFGIVKNLKGKAGIIDSSGTSLKGFEFNYYEIIPNRNTKDTINTWLFVRKSETENYSLVNTKGENKFDNEIFTYPLTSLEAFGYAPYQKGDTSALFDRFTMKWVIKPQTKIKIEGMFFSSKKYLNSDIPKNRSDAVIYYLVSDKNSRYFMDLKGNKYLPKK